MIEHPILFSTEMVRAILGGRKTQTRRVIKTQPPQIWDACKEIFNQDKSHCGWSFYNSADPDFHGYLKNEHPYGRIGDHLWVRESFFDNRGIGEVSFDGPDAIYYRADGEIWKQVECTEGFTGWKPSIFMPRAASRITLEITDIRVERVQDISEGDAKAEGIAAGLFVGKAPDQYLVTNRDGTKRSLNIYQNEYRFLWDKLNKKRGYAFHKNPFVWVIEFKMIKPKGAI